MNRLKPSRTAFVLLALAAWSVALTAQLHLTREQVARLEQGGINPAVVTAVQGELAELKRMQTELHAQALDGLTAQEGYEQRLTDLAALLDSERQAIVQLRDELAEAAPRQSLSALTARLNTLDAQLQALKASRATAPQPATTAKAAPPPRQARATPPAVPSPPFAALGIESRGGEPFLAVLPSGAHSLGHVRLLRPGERFGSWQLRQLEHNAARFSVEGHLDQTLSIR